MSDWKEQQIFQSIICKFLLNLPQFEIRDPSRVCFHCQKAYYYYKDCIQPQYEKQQEIKQKWGEERVYFFNKLESYIQNIKKHHKIYQKYLPSITCQQLMNRLGEMKPVCGAIILNAQQTKVVVIKTGKKFGFPKGKWNEEQKPQQCAARQVHQQTGLYIHNKIDKNQKVQFTSREVQSIFFIVRGFSESQKFKIDKNEVDEVFWMKISQISRLSSRFVQKSRIAWKMYLETNYSPLKIDQFLKIYGSDSLTKNTVISFDGNFQNPLLNFKFDTQKLMSVFHQ